MLRQYAEQRGWQVADAIEEEASAGDLRRRVKWRELLGRVRDGGIDAILVTRLDRAFRSGKHCYDTLEYLDAHNIAFITTTQAIDTTTSMGKLVLGVLAAVAEFEKDLIRERTIEGLEKAKSNGKVLGRPKGAKDKRKRRRSGYFARYAE